MIDLDRMDAQLASALTVAVGAKTPPPAASTSVCVRELLERGLLAEADAAMASSKDRVEVVTWATMRALLDGRRADVAAGLEEMLALAQSGDDNRVSARYWTQRFWAAFEWGTGDDRLDVLDHCRERAYRFDEITWWGNLSLLLAVMGKADEAARALDTAQPMLGGIPKDAAWLDVVTNLVEAAAMLGDGSRAASLHRSLRWPEGRMVVVGEDVVCKGSLDRYLALGHAAVGDWRRAAECFGAAEAAHRALGAEPLLARTLRQATGSRVAA